MGQERAEVESRQGVAAWGEVIFTEKDEEKSNSINYKMAMLEIWQTINKLTKNPQKQSWRLPKTFIKIWCWKSKSVIKTTGGGAYSASKQSKWTNIDNKKLQERPVCTIVL